MEVSRSRPYKEADLKRNSLINSFLRVYVWLSPFSVHLKLSQHYLLIGYTPKQNFKVFKKGQQQQKETLRLPTQAKEISNSGVEKKGEKKRKAPSCRKGL